MGFSLVVLCQFHREQNVAPYYFKNQWRIVSKTVKRNKNEYLEDMFNDMEAIQSFRVYVDK
jgi:hypothetical protein